MSNPAPIRELRSDVVDQIAAGEVVERPAHLVKELVENALDAHATQIEVEFDEGGRRVRVTDNGSGIGSGDLKLALARHATSKIAAAEDIWKLNSYGFRGEALASIGAVSALELLSRPPVAAVAHRVRAKYGSVSDVEPSSGNFGTTVTIDGLFENVPARLKFMKSEAAEGAQIRAVVKAAALSAPAVGFRLKTKGRIEFVLKDGEDFLARAKTLLGIELHAAAGEFEGIKAEIAFSGPQDVLGNSKGLWFFVQNRWIQDRSLQAAVQEAYRGLLMHGEYPYAVVKLTVPDGEVDVNIHPTKSAVKFRDPARAFRAVSRTLRAAIEQAPWLNAGKRGSVQASGAIEASPVRSESVTAAVTSYALSDFTRTYKPESAAVDGLQTHSPSRFESIDFDRVQRPAKAGAVVPALRPPNDVAPRTGSWSRLEVLGQAALTYIVCQDGDRLVFVDQHAAHERVAYEKLMRAWKKKTAKDSEIESQALLLPLVVEMELEFVEALATQVQDLERMGLSLEVVGPRAVAARSIPVLLKESAIEGSLKELAQAVLDRGGGEVFEDKIGDVFARMACHSVVRAGQALSNEQMRALLLQMDEFPLSSFCPHGRPVSVEYPFARLERDFGRTV